MQMFLLSDLVKVVATYELPEIETPEDAIFGNLKFVVQVLRRPNGVYIPRVLRKERVQVAPAYYEKKDRDLLDQVTVEIVVPEDSCDWESFECVSENDAVQYALDELQRLLGR
jgi:hypothetical protein